MGKKKKKLAPVEPVGGDIAPNYQRLTSKMRAACKELRSLSTNLGYIHIDEVAQRIRAIANELEK